ncbi:MAG: hypothetical protein RIT07_1256 [Bacteroidota bacterium]|jgi:hypothetical protein
MADFQSFVQEITGLGYVSRESDFYYIHPKGPDVVFVPMGIMSHIVNSDRYTIIIHEDVWKFRSNAVINRLKALTGQTQRIHGRACKIKRIDKITAAAFLENYHTAGHINSYYKYGIYFNQELLGVALFAKRRTFLTNDKSATYHSSELTRFACKTGIRIVGGLEKVIQAFCLQYNIAHLMTYADREWTDGKTYFSLGFVKTGFTPPLTFWASIKTGERLLYNDKNTQQQDDWSLKRNLGNLKLELIKNPRT